MAETRRLDRVETTRLTSASTPPSPPTTRPSPVVAREWPAAVKPLESFLCMNPRCPEAVRITRERAKGRPQFFASDNFHR